MAPKLLQVSLSDSIQQALRVPDSSKRCRPTQTDNRWHRIAAVTEIPTSHVIQPVAMSNIPQVDEKPYESNVALSIGGGQNCHNAE